MLRQQAFKLVALLYKNFLLFRREKKFSTIYIVACCNLI